MTSVADRPVEVRKGSPDRGTRIPEDWKRSPADIAWQRAEGIPDNFARVATGSFRDYFRSAVGPRARKLNWSMAWKVWMRRDWYGMPLYKRQQWIEQAESAAAPARHVPEALAR